MLAWLGKQLDPLVNAIEVVLLDAGDGSTSEPNLGELSYCLGSLRGLLNIT